MSPSRIARCLLPLTACVMLMACGSDKAAQTTADEPGQSHPTGAGEGDSCGGMQSTPCAARLYCAKGISVRACRAMNAGVCKPLPTACPEGGQQVCGCDHKVYSSACAAAKAGVAAQKTGTCEGLTCGGRAGDTCAKGDYCAFGRPECDAADRQGTCMSYPASCGSGDQPVKSCYRGKSFANLCEAHKAGLRNLVLARPGDD